MDWITLKVWTTTEGADVISEALMELGSKGTMIEDKNDIALHQKPEGRWDIIDPEIAERMGDDVKVTGYYPKDERMEDVARRIEERICELRGMDLGIDLGKLIVETDQVDEEDWAESWKKDYVPMRLGEHMVVKPGWVEYDAQPGDEIIEIDPGMAFGTGTHETTALCVGLVEQYVSPGMRVFDIGTGTGILAIAAAKCGAAPVLATDIDSVAVRVATENVRLNGLEHIIEVREADLLRDIAGTAHVVIANIIADVIISIAAPARGLIEDGGMFICSGIARERKGEVVDALNAAGYASLDVRDKGEWTAIAARK